MGNLNSTISHILLESNNPDVSGKYTLFTLHNDNTGMLHIFEDEETFEAMKYKFTSNDGIKRLGAAKLPENTTFKKLTENIERKFGVPKERFTIRTHEKVQEEAKPQPKDVNVSPKPRKGKDSVVESVLKGRERFTKATYEQPPVQQEKPREPTINSFKPATSRKIDLSRLHDGDSPPMLG